MRVLLSVVLSLAFLANSAMAARDFPRGCEAIGYEFQDGQLVLQPKPEEGQQALYMIHNISNDNIVIANEPPEDAIVAAVWETDVKRYRWASFAMNKSDVRFNCNVVKYRDDKQKVNCADVVKVCTYPRAKFALGNMGTYWVTTNKSQSDAVRKAIQKGILLRW